MKRKIIIFAILFCIIALPAAAHAANILDFSITAIFGCFANFSSSCSVNDKMLFTSVACKVMKTIDSAVIPIYCNITLNPNYRMALDALFILYITLFGLGFLTGTTRARLGVVITAMLKVACVYFILTYSGAFFSLIYATAIETPRELIRVTLAVNGSSASSIFEYVDQGMYKIFEQVNQPALGFDDRQTVATKQLSFLAIAIGVKQFIPGGNFVYGLFMFVVMGWLFSYLSIVVRYLLSYLALTFMLMLSPIFIPSILFKRTAFLFDEWFRMVISFIIEIILVVGFVIMIAPFYSTFYDMLNKSFNGLQIEKKETSYLKSYNNETNKEFVKQEAVSGYQNPEPAMRAAGLGNDANDISANVIINLVTMGVIVFLASAFLRYIPTLASMLSGKYQYSKMFGGEQFAQKASGAGRANLYGQTGYAGKQDAVTPDSDRPGGIWGDLSSFRL